MAIFNSKLLVYQRIIQWIWGWVKLPMKIVTFSSYDLG